MRCEGRGKDVFWGADGAGEGALELLLEDGV